MLFIKMFQKGTQNVGELKNNTFNRSWLYRVKSQISYFRFFFNHTLYSDHKTEEIFQKYQIKKKSRLFYQMACNRVNFGIQETLKTDLFQLELFPED